MCADQGNHLNDASFKYGRFGCPAVAALLGNKSLTVVQEMNILASFHQTIGAQRSSPYNNNEWLNVFFPILPGDKEKIAKFLIWKSQTRGAFGCVKYHWPMHVHNYCIRNHFSFSLSIPRERPDIISTIAGV